MSISTQQSDTTPNLNEREKLLKKCKTADLIFFIRATTNQAVKCTTIQNSTTSRHHDGVSFP